MCHIFEQNIKNLIEILGFQVKEDCALEDEVAELHEGVHGEGGDMRLAPPVGPLLHVLLKPNPPRRLLPLVTPVSVPDQLLQLREQLMRSVVFNIIICISCEASIFEHNFF